MAIASAFEVLIFLLEMAILISEVVVGKKEEQDLKEIIGRSDDE